MICVTQIKSRIAVMRMCPFKVESVAALRLIVGLIYLPQISRIKLNEKENIKNNSFKTSSWNEE